MVPIFSRGRALLPACLAIVFAGLALLLVEYWFLSGRREDRGRLRAEQAAESRQETARAYMARGNWDEAVRLLEEAAAVEGGGPAAAGARALLPEARRGQADALFEAARSALAARDVARAQRLLRQYLAQPHGSALGE